MISKKVILKNLTTIKPDWQTVYIAKQIKKNNIVVKDTWDSNFIKSIKEPYVWQIKELIYTEKDLNEIFTNYKELHEKNKRSTIS